MATALNEPLTPDQILKQMGEIVRNTNADTFRVRIARKANSQQIMPQVIATLDGATLDHLQSPEVWLSQLSGGGHYFLSAVHKSNPTAPFAPMQVIIDGQPLPPDPFADASPTWRGPAEIVMPEKPRGGNTAGDDRILHVGPTGAMGTPPRNGVPQGSAPVGPAPSSADPLVVERWRLEQQREEVARRDRVAAEERHKQELDLLKRANELEAAKLRAEIAGSRKPEGESEMSKFLMVMREEAKLREEKEERRRQDERDREMRHLQQEREREDRRLVEERQREDRRLEREREDRKERDAERQRMEERLGAERKEANERFMQLMTERASSQEQMMKMMAPISEMMGTSMNVVVQALHSIQELAPQGDAEPPYIKLVGKIVDGIQAAAEATRQDRRVRLPPMRGAPPQQQQPQRRPPPARAAPPPPPAPPPVLQPSTSPPPARFDGIEPAAPPAPAPAPKPGPTAMETLVAMAKAKRPPEEVARFFYSHVNDPSIARELAANGMMIVPTFTPHFLAWLQESEENQKYMREVFTAVNRIGEEMGVVEPVNGEEEDEGEEEEGGEDDGEEEAAEAEEGDLE